MPTKSPTSLSASPLEALALKDMELNSLLELINAINRNATQGDLYKMYKWTMRSFRIIKKLMLWTIEEENWLVRAAYGVENVYKKLDPVFRDVTNIRRADFLETIPLFNEFELVIPISHKEQVLAFVFISTEESQQARPLDLKYLTALTNVMVVALENKKLANKQKKQDQVRIEMNTAKNAQLSLLPSKLPNNERFCLLSTYIPIFDVGGDYYDYIPIDENRFLFCIADVSGKSISAALLMSNMQAGLRILTHKQFSLQEIMEELNYLLYQNTGGNYFITAFVGIYDFTKQRLEYVNAGHNPPFLIRKEKDEVHELKKGSTMLGAFPMLPGLEVGIKENLGAFRLFCFTDGITEAQNEHGEELGETLLSEFIIKQLDQPLQQIHDNIVWYLKNFNSAELNLSDDFTLLSLEVFGEGK